MPSQEQINNLPVYLESKDIQIAGLIVQEYSDTYSHHLAISSLSEWLIKNDIPAICGVDTRALTKKVYYFLINIDRSNSSKDKRFWFTFGENTDQRLHTN